MVTTSTVSTVSSLVAGDSAGAFTLVAIALLACLLCGRELFSYSQGARARQLTRGLDIAVLPLICAFVLILILQSVAS